MKKNNNADFPIKIVFAVPVLFFIVGVVFIPLGIVKSAEFKKAEKIYVSFTEPVSSVTEKTETNADDETEHFYVIRVPYEYNGQKYVHEFRQEKSVFGKTYKVGDLVTFTKTFSPNGQQISNGGTFFLIFGGVSIAVSLPWLILYVAMRPKKGKAEEAQTPC
ncbi:MAG: hypothetical protein IJK02_01095 [Clostridia bacterium]|nr:hypothetical protein [Clostridia bacterium]